MYKDKNKNRINNFKNIKKMYKINKPKCKRKLIEKSGIIFILFFREYET
jgi:hypothetical protein